MIDTTQLGVAGVMIEREISMKKSAEIDRLRTELDSIRRYLADAQAGREEASRELAEARADTRRLDWMIEYEAYVEEVSKGRYRLIYFDAGDQCELHDSTAKEAIDAGMRATGETEARP